MGSFLFQRLGVLHVGQKLEEQDEFEKIYKNGKCFLDQRQSYSNFEISNSIDLAFWLSFSSLSADFYLFSQPGPTMQMLVPNSMRGPVP